jgi:hypothetical protein
MRTNQQVKDLNLPHCNWRDFIRFTGEGTVPEKDAEALDAYFIHFVYDPDTKCIKCGGVQGTEPGIMGALKPGLFRYGIQHGEGQCVKCGWPARALHYNVGPLKTLELILQYHPDVVTWDK